MVIKISVDSNQGGARSDSSRLLLNTTEEDQEEDSSMNFQMLSMGSITKWLREINPKETYHVACQLIPLHRLEHLARATCPGPSQAERNSFLAGALWETTAPAFFADLEKKKKKLKRKFTQLSISPRVFSLF